MNAFASLLFDYKMRKTKKFIIRDTFKIKMPKYILWALNTQPKHYIFSIYKPTLNKKSSFNKSSLQENLERQEENQPFFISQMQQVHFLQFF